jgi:ADP-Ribosyltransferase in polyvalent proteins
MNAPTPFHLGGKDSHTSTTTTAGPASNSGIPWTRSPVSDAPSFRSWFSGSKVVAPDGAPRILYHASRAEFAHFKMRTKGRQVGFHFGTLAAAQEHQHWVHKYKRRDLYRPGAHIRPVYLAIRNPLRVLDVGCFTVWRLLDAFARRGTPEQPGSRYWCGLLTPAQYGEVTALTEVPWDRDKQARLRLITLLEAQGYDGRSRPTSMRTRAAIPTLHFVPDRSGVR